MTHRPTLQPHRSCQRGAAALAVSVVLLFAMTLATFFLNRGLLFEQKTSANQYRATRAFEVAEAGIEWATAMVNDSSVINASCIPTAAQPSSFRDRYVPGVGTPVNLTPPANTRPGCRITDAGALICNCPAVGNDANLGTSTDRKFTVRFEDVGIPDPDPKAVRLTAVGCINQSALCTDANSNSGGDATARISVILKLRPVLRAAPAAALTTGAWTQVCGSLFSVVNTSAIANGYLVNAGGEVQIGVAKYLSGPLPPAAGSCSGTGQELETGTPLAFSIATGDSELASIAAGTDAMFTEYFGTALSQYVSASSTCTISGADPGNRAAKLIEDYGSVKQCRHFWIDGPIAFSGNHTLGTASDPVVLVSASSMSFNGNFQLYGLVFSDSAVWNEAGFDSRVFGAVVARTSYRNNGTGTVNYDADVLAKTRNSGPMVRVPGSWRDFPE